MAHFLTNLAGLNFRPKESKDVVLMLGVGEELTLKREPDNAYDSDAIQIWAADFDGLEYFIGYVESVANPPIAELMDGGTELKAVVAQTYPRTEDKGDKAWMRPLIRIEVVGEERLRGSHVDAEGNPLDAKGIPLDDDIPY